MILYHGTSLHYGSKIIGNPINNVDVTKGGGELGQGFYLGNNIVLAHTLAIGKFGKNGRVLRFSIKDEHLVQLEAKAILKRKDVYEQWQKLFRERALKTFRYNVDYVVGPFAVIDFAEQYKFESFKSEAILNQANAELV